MKTKYLAILAGVAVALYALKKSNKENTNNNSSSSDPDNGGNTIPPTEYITPPEWLTIYEPEINFNWQTGLPTNFPAKWKFTASNAGENESYIQRAQHGKIVALDVFDAPNYHESGLFVIYQDGYEKLVLNSNLEKNYDILKKVVEMALYDGATIKYFAPDYMEWALGKNSPIEVFDYVYNRIYEGKSK